jgi:hypothetical protein
VVPEVVGLDASSSGGFQTHPLLEVVPDAPPNNAVAAGSWMDVRVLKVVYATAHCPDFIYDIEKQFGG